MINLQSYKPATLLKRDPKCFPVNIAESLKTSILKETCERLLLNVIDSKWNNRKNRDVFIDDNRRRIQNPVKYLRWSFSQK